MSALLTREAGAEEVDPEEIDPAASRAPRVMVVWCPDWPVVAAAAELGLAVTDPVAVVEGEIAPADSRSR